MRYLYYKLWQLFTKVKTNDMPATNSIFFLSMCHIANILVIHLLLDKLSITKIDLESKSEVYYFTIPLGILVMILNYIYLYKSREKIYEKYKGENERQKIIGNILIVLYIIVSFTLVFYFSPKYTDSIAG